MTHSVSNNGPGYTTEPQTLIHEIGDLVAEANVLASRYSSSEDSQRERAAFRDRKRQVLDRLNAATSPTILAAEREAGR